MSLTKYLAVARLSSNEANNKHAIISDAAADNNDPDLKQYRKHINDIMKKGASRISAGKRIRLTSEENNYDLYITAYPYDGEEKAAFFVIVDTKFGVDASISKLFEEYKEGFFKLVDAKTIGSAKAKGKAHKKTEAFLQQILVKYGSSKLDGVKNQVDEIKGVMVDNINVVLRNVETLEDLEGKAENLQRQGQVFADNATTLKSKQKWAYYKSNMMIAGVVLVIIGILALVIWALTA